ncbi:MAG: hypothetical protein ABFD10_06725 [Prolixibacteraceae bacterium]
MFTIFKMIQNIKHKGLKLYWTKGDRSKLPLTMVQTIETVMAIVDNLEIVPDDLYPFPKLKPHPLKGDRQGVQYPATGALPSDSTIRQEWHTI